MDQRANSSRTLIVRLFHLAVESRRLLALSLLCGLLFSVVGLFPPLVLRRLIQLLQEGSLAGSTLTWMALALAGLFLLRGVFRYGYGVFSHVAAYRTLHNLLGRTYARVQALPPGAHTHRRSGALMSRTVNDVEVIEDFLAHGVPEIFLAAVMPGAMLLILFNIHFELALIVTLPLPLIAWLVYRLSGRTSRAWRKTRGRRADLVADILDRIGGHSVIKSFVREESELRRVRRASARYRDSIVRANLWSLIPAGVVEFAGGLAYLLVVAAGGHLALGGDVALADLVVFILYLGQIFQPLLRLASLNDVIQKAAASAHRVFELLEQPVESPGAGLVALPGDLRWSVELDRVTFGYAPENPVLRGVSFRAEAGEVLALVGPTGAGKTTSCNLVPRFYEPQSEQSESAGSTFATWPSARCGVAWPTSCRTCISSTPPSGRTSWWATPRPPKTRCVKPPGPPTPRISSSPCPRATTPWSGKGARASREARNSGFPSLAPSSRTHPS